VIRQLQGELARLGVKIEVRNQARVHLMVSGEAWPTLPGAALLTDGIQPLLDDNNPGRNPPHASRSRRLCRRRGLRILPHGRSSQFRAKFFSRQLRGKRNALEGALAELTVSPQMVGPCPCCRRNEDRPRRTDGLASASHNTRPCRSAGFGGQGTSRRTEHTAITRLGFEFFAATFADVEKLQASVGIVSVA